MQRRTFMKLGAGALGVVAGRAEMARTAQPTASDTRRPNLLFIMSDQQRLDTLGCYGNRFIRTPQVDRLAGEGAVLERMYSAASVCMPSRSTLLTGRYPSNHGCYMNGVPLPYDQVTLAHALLREGYRTAAVGKMHLQPIGKSRGEPSPESKEYWDSGKRLPVPYYGFQQVRLANDHGPTEHGDYYNYLTAIDPKLPGLLRADKALEPPSGAPSSWKSAIPVQHHVSNWVADESIALLKEFARYREPFMLFVSFPDPHFPFSPPAPYCYQYDPADVPMPRRSLREVETASPLYRWRLQRFAQAFGYHPTKMPEAYIREIIAHYYGMISLMDEAIGRVLAQLRDSGLEQDTLVLFTTDHGEHLGDHWLIYKAAHYRELFHLPFILRLPNRIRPGTRLTGFHSFVDVMPTLLDLMGVKAPPTVQGQSLAGTLRGGAERGRDAVLVQDDNPGTPEYWRTMWTDRYRLTLVGGNLQRYGVSSHTGELFDLQEDPAEFQNLFDHPKYRSLRGELAEQMADLTFREFDPVPPKVADY